MDSLIGRLLAIVLASASAPTLWASDNWRQWRGPNRDAISPDKGLLDHWEKPPPLLWKSEHFGGGHAGVVVDRGVVCTMGHGDRQWSLVAFNEKDGRKLWTAGIDDSIGGGHLGVGKCTPTMDGGRVYVLCPNGCLACFKTAAGERIWERSFKQEFGGVYAEYGYAESPLVDGDQLICTPGAPKAGIMAFNKKTGEEMWRCQLSFDDGVRSNGATYSSVVVSHGAGVKQYVQLLQQGLVGVDAKTRKLLWRYPKVTGGNMPCTPIICGDYVFLPCGYYVGSVLLKLTPKKGGGVEAKEVYLLPPIKLQTDSGGAVLVGDYVYGSHVRSGRPQCIELTTGKLMWDKGRGPGTGPAAVVYADGHLYYRYENGVVALVAATPDKYRLKGKFRTPQKENQAWSHPAICNGRLYLRNDDVIYCYDLKK